jgi:hypothetical protein
MHVAIEPHKIDATPQHWNPLVMETTFFSQFSSNFEENSYLKKLELPFLEILTPNQNIRGFEFWIFSTVYHFFIITNSTPDDSTWCAELKSV